ncbi:sulfotransferase, partial [bacterium]|nr:sulfotransferase [candidate division CSSED10-310 bacterium]
IGSPRSGSTLLQRMLDSHSHIYSRPEPHIITPLAHLGYFATVDKAPYDHLRGVDAIREYVEDLPHREADYLDACRAYTDVLYGRMFEDAGRKMNARFFLDKTPAYALVLDFLAKLYPRAKYVVLTRHPAAIFCSYANSFFDGDFVSANQFNPILNRYVPAMARFIENKPVPMVHVIYEDMVRDPEAHMQRICEYLGVPYEKEAIEYGKHDHIEKGLGDPTGIKKHSRPSTSSVHKWAGELAADPEKYRFVKSITDSLDAHDLEIWGYDKNTLYEVLETGEFGEWKPPKQKKNKHYYERKLLLLMRRNIHRNAFGRLVKKIRFTCDVLLR